MKSASVSFAAVAAALSYFDQKPNLIRIAAGPVSISQKNRML
jgi:hypothetical protein